MGRGKKKGRSRFSGNAPCLSGGQWVTDSRPTLSSRARPDLRPPRGRYPHLSGGGLRPSSGAYPCSPGPRQTGGPEPPDARKPGTWAARPSVSGTPAQGVRSRGRYSQGHILSAPRAGNGVWDIGRLTHPRGAGVAKAAPAICAGTFGVRMSLCRARPCPALRGTVCQLSRACFGMHVVILSFALAGFRVVLALDRGNPGASPPRQGGQHGEEARRSGPWG